MRLKDICRRRHLPRAAAAVSLAAALASAGLATPALAGGVSSGGLIWSQPQQAVTLNGSSPHWVSKLVVDGGNQYLAYVDSAGTLWLATNAGGKWANYSVGNVTSVPQNGTEGHPVSLAVQSGVAYVGYWSSDQGVHLAYDPSGSPGGPWVDSTVAPGTTFCGANASTTVGNPSVAIAFGARLWVAFDVNGPCTTGSSAAHVNVTDIYVASTPLASLTAAGGPSQWQTADLTAKYTSSQNWAPYIVAAGGTDISTLALIFDASGALAYVHGSTQPQVVTTPSQDFGWQLQAAVGNGAGQGGAAAAGSYAGIGAVALYAGGPGTVGDMVAATNAGGSWAATTLFPSDAVHSARPAAAVGFCGPAVAYDAEPQSNATGDQLTVAAFGGGHWNPQAVGALETSMDPMWPGLAATATGFDLTYINDDSGSAVLYTATATCGPAVNAVSPASGPAAGGTTVTVTGTGFTGATQVNFAGSTANGNSGSGGPAASFTVASDTQITAVTPPGSGTVDVTVTTPGGGSPTVPADQFTYQPGAAAGGQSSGGVQGSGGQPAGGAPGSAHAAAFGDLQGYQWAASAINTLAGQGIVNGVASGSFKPGGLVTRAQFAALVQRLFKLPVPSHAVTFGDVPASFWGHAAVEAASPYFDYFQVPGGGYAFHPNDPFDRQDVATVIVRLLAKSGKLTVLGASDAQAVLAKVTDASSIPPALVPYVATAVKAGIMTGFPDGSFQPQGLLNRAQVAVLLLRLENSFVTVSGS